MCCTFVSEMVHRSGVEPVGGIVPFESIELDKLGSVHHGAVIVEG